MAALDRPTLTVDSATMVKNKIIVQGKSVVVRDLDTISIVELSDVVDWRGDIDIVANCLHQHTLALISLNRERVVTDDATHDALGARLTDRHDAKRHHTFKRKL